ncbi:MAG: cytochrome c oxidase subunit IV [Polyangiaceae bacterium]|nr:cytochrome c oxidase subunit IV [Polyangiaceae bacterium]
MSHAESHDSHHSHGPDHVPHVTPLPVYLATFGTLCVLTVVTVGASYINLGTTVNLFIALIIATIKATVVALFFMHLKSDLRFHSVVFGSSVVFLIIFISFTMFDTNVRGQFEPQKRHRPAIMTDPFAAPSAPTATPSAAAAPAGSAPAGSQAPAHP